MTLRQMVDFRPSDLDMAMLPLEVTVYIRVSVISLYKEDNYAFLRYFFAQDIADEFYHLGNTVIYDFDGTDTKQERFVSVLELYSIPNLAQISDHLKEILEGYDHTADVVIDFFTHDDKEYRLSNLDGIVKLEEIRTDGEKETVELKQETASPVEEEVVLKQEETEPVQETIELKQEEPLKENDKEDEEKITLVF